MEMTRDELAEYLKKSVKAGCVERIQAVLDALNAQGQAPYLSQAEDLIPEISIVLDGFEQITGKNGEALVELKGTIEVLFGNDEKGAYLKDLGLEFRPFTIRVEDGYYLGVNDQPMLPDIVRTLAHLPTEEAEIDLNTATIRFYRPLNGWEGFYLCLWLDPAEPYWFVAGDLTEIRVAWD
jgi:hypothetical protein